MQEYFHLRSKRNKLDTTMTDLPPLLFQFRDTGDHSPETQMIKIKGVLNINPSQKQTLTKP